MQGREYLSLAEVQRVMLGMLIVFDSICREHGLRYSLDGGTLLGAVRHSGFIPWDDDVDVLMPRPDYEELLAHTEWVPSGMGIAHSGSQEYDFEYPFAKLYDLEWHAIEPGYSTRLHEFIWVDIFPADAVPDDDAVAKKLLAKQRRAHIRGLRSFINPVEIDGTSIKQHVKRCVYPLHSKIFPSDVQFAAIAKNASALAYGSTNRVADLVWPYWKEKWIPTSDFERLIVLPFEGKEFSAIPSWDLYLAELYGDYRTLPPIDQRYTHKTLVWKSISKG